MKKPILIILLIALFLIAFITNPSRDRHVDNGLEIIFNTNDGGEDYGIVGGLISTFAKETLNPKLNYRNFYLFSVSDIHSNDRNKTLRLGLGVFGQVFPLSDHGDFESYRAESQSTPEPNTQSDKQERNRPSEIDEKDKKALDLLINGPGEGQ